MLHMRERSNCVESQVGFWLDSYKRKQVTLMTIMLGKSNGQLCTHDLIKKTAKFSKKRVM